MKSSSAKARALLSTSLLLCSSVSLHAQSEKEIISSQKVTIEQLKSENEKLRKQLGLSNPAPAAKSKEASTSSYVVQKGDSLFKISQKFGVSVKALATANSIKDGKSIYSGQKLTIPKKGSISSSKSTTSTTTQKKSLPDVYKIQKGDTYFSIAKKYGISVNSLMAANPRIKASRLVPGYTVIKFPSKTKTSTVVKKQEKKPVQKKAAAPVVKNKVKETKTPITSPYKEITLVSEMTFGDLASRYGMTTSQLNELNGWNYKSTTKLAKGSVAYVKNK